MVGQPEFNNTVLLDDNVNMVKLNQMTVWEDRPVSIAQAILDKSKNIMTNFYYGLSRRCIETKQHCSIVIQIVVILKFILMTFLKT